MDELKTETKKEEILSGPFADHDPDFTSGVPHGGREDAVEKNDKPVQEAAQKTEEYQEEDKREDPKKRHVSRPIVEVRDVSVIYNKGKSSEVRSLDGVTVDIYPQEYLIIFGPSGCGKSTLLYSISGLQAPTNGKVSVEGKVIAEMNKKELVDLHRLKMGMIFQAFYLIPSLTVIDNVCLPKVFCGESKKSRREDGIKLLRRFGIVEQGNKFPSQLSGGQKQRVSIARSLINNPKVILADEPVGNLDSESSMNVLQILKELNEIDKKTIILVTHNTEHLHFADRVLHMRDGKIIREEIIRDKRPVDAKEEKKITEQMELSPDLAMLMRTFKSLSPQQIGALLVPYKSSQLLYYLLSGMTEEQMSTAKGYLSELLFDNITVDELGKNLDLDIKKGGAGWNKKKALSFAKRVNDILDIVKRISDAKDQEATLVFSHYLIERFKLHLDDEMRLRFETLVRLRVQSKIDQTELQKKLDVSKVLGGVGLIRSVAEKVAHEIEVIMLLKYTV